MALNTDLASILDPSKIVGEHDGIYLTAIDLPEEVKVSQTAWEGIYDLDLAELESERADFFENKLDDHLAVIDRFEGAKADNVCLEIGCGPAYIGEYLMRHRNMQFVGIDFNFKVLQSLHSYFEKERLTDYLLIHADINTMPLRDQCVNFIYGGGVIEHFEDTQQILTQSHRVLKKGGVVFNSVPAFNLSWLPVRCYNNIPAVPALRPALTFLHMKVLKNRILERNYGFELSFTRKRLATLHRHAGFKTFESGPFRFHPSTGRLKSPLLRDLYFRLSGIPQLAPMYYAAATK